MSLITLEEQNLCLYLLLLPCLSIAFTAVKDFFKHIQTKLDNYVIFNDLPGLSGDEFRFDNNGDGPARYNILHFKQVLPGQYRWLKVGQYLDGVLELNLSGNKLYYAFCPALHRFSLYYNYVHLIIKCQIFSN